MDYMNLYEYLGRNRIGKIKFRKDTELKERIVKAIYSGKPIPAKDLLNICDTYAITPNEISEELTATTTELRLFVRSEAEKHKTRTDMRPISQYTIDGEFIKSFNGMREAYAITNVHYSGIIKCCQGKRHTAGGYIWKYI